MTPKHSRQTEKRKKHRFSFLQVLSETFLLAGLTAALFVVWQLYWTDLETRPKVEAALQEFPEIQQGCTVAPEVHTDNIPEIPTVEENDVYGVIHVPSWDMMRIPLAQGTSNYVLDQGFAGHYPSTQQVGEVGNFAVAGHRRTNGSNFRHLDKLVPGDEVIVETNGYFFVYEFVSSEIVLPSQSSVLYPVPNEDGVTPTKRLMTMTTCNPEYGNSERLIGYLEFRYWTNADECPPIPLQEVS